MYNYLNCYSPQQSRTLFGSGGVVSHLDLEMGSGLWTTAVLDFQYGIYLQLSSTVRSQDFYFAAVLKYGRSGHDQIVR